MSAKIKDEPDEEKAKIMYNDFIRFREKTMLDYTKKKLQVTFKNREAKMDLFRRDDLMQSSEKKVEKVKEKPKSPVKFVQEEKIKMNIKDFL